MSENRDAEVDPEYATLRYCEQKWSEERTAMFDTITSERARATAAEAERDRLKAQLHESAMDHIARDLTDEMNFDRLKAAEATLREKEAEIERLRTLPTIEFHQQDWIPGFAAFLPGSTTPQPDSRAFCVLNLGSMLSTVANGDVPAADLPGFIVESMIHEVGHVLEQWAGIEFSEERVEALCDQYRAALTQPATPARSDEATR